MKTVLVPLAEGFEEIEAVAAIDVLRRGKDVEVTVAGVGTTLVRGSHGVMIQTDLAIESVVGREYDLIVLPGGMPGTKHLAESEAVVRLVKDQAEAGRLLGAICAAPTVLERNGVLKGVRATSHFSVKDQLKRCLYVDEPVVEDGKIVTSQGAGTAVEFALVLVEILAGEKESSRIANAIRHSIQR